jgi:hypothetical protein
MRFMTFEVTKELSLALILKSKTLNLFQGRVRMTLFDLGHGSGCQKEEECKLES